VTYVLETLKKTQLISNKTSLIYIGHMIGGGEMRVDPEKIEAITQWSIPTNVVGYVLYSLHVCLWACQI
jgi:hypothetical protein